MDQVAPELCRMADLACDFLLMAIAGPSKHLNASRIQVRLPCCLAVLPSGCCGRLWQVYVSATPAGTSTLNMLHWTQSVRAPVFQMMDLGSSAANFRRYGSFVPPTYNLSALAVRHRPCCALSLSWWRGVERGASQYLTFLLLCCACCGRCQRLCSAETMTSSQTLQTCRG